VVARMEMLTTAASADSPLYGHMVPDKSESRLVRRPADGPTTVEGAFGLLKVAGAAAEV
jgi:hypothetical protein